MKEGLEIATLHSLKTVKEYERKPFNKKKEESQENPG